MKEKHVKFQFQREFFNGLLIFLMLLGCVSVHAGMTVTSSNQWNGTVTYVNTGNNIQFDCTGYKGEVIISATCEIKDSDYPSDLFQGLWIENKNSVKFQRTSSDFTGKFCVSLDESTGLLTISLGSCGASIVADKSLVCKGSDVTLSMAGADESDAYTTQWGFLTSSDTTWLTDYDNEKSVVVTVSANTTYLLKYTSSAGAVTVSSVDVELSLGACGYKVIPADTAVCPGQEIVLTSDYTSASTYVWKDEMGTVLASSSSPTLKITPVSSAVYSLYADGLLVGESRINATTCGFYITAYYPTSTCLQESNYLSAMGAEVLSDLSNNVFSWEQSEDGSTWKSVENGNKSTLAVSSSKNMYYRVTYKTKVSPAFYYEAPDCSNSEKCNGLQTRVLFYETFGYFVNENTYVVNNKVYVDSVTFNGGVAALKQDNTLLGYAGNHSSETTSYFDRIKNGTDYYSARITNSDKLEVRPTDGTTTFAIQKFVAPDVLGNVVMPTEFVNVASDGDANQFVGTDGHLFLCANPLLSTYGSWISDDPSYRLQDGYYAIVTNPDSVDRHNHEDYLDCTDATGNVNGAMLFVNSGKTDVSRSAIYAQRVTLGCSADRFSFGMNIRNAAKKEGLNPVNISVLLLEDISNELPEEYKALGDVKASHILNDEIQSGDIPSASADWTRMDQYVQLENGKTVNSLWVVLFNNGQPGNGNDILLDDISFSVCLPKAELSANIDGNLIVDDVTVCNGEDLELVAAQKGDYIQNPLYLFQYLDTLTNTWIDMKDYSDPSLYENTKALIKVTDTRFVGKVKYRVIIGSTIEELRQVALNPTDICNEFLVAESDINVNNLYGGPMMGDYNKPFCFVEGDTIEVEAGRNLTDPLHHSWKMVWRNSLGNVLVDTTDATGHSTDILHFVVGKDSSVTIYDRNWTKTVETNFEGISALTFVAIDGEDCIHEQNITLQPKHIVNLSFDGSSAVGCDSIKVEIAKDVKNATLDWNWSLPGRVNVVNDTTQVFYPEGLNGTATKSGDLKISVLADGEDYCAPAYPLTIPYQVHNVSYGVSVIPSSSPVCVTKGQAPETILLTLTANITPSEAKNNITSYNWYLKFEKGDEIYKTTSSDVFSLTYNDLQGRTGQKLSAYLLSTETVDCGTITNDTSSSSTDIDIREGGFLLDIEPSSSTVCLTSDDKIELTTTVSPASALTNLTNIVLTDENLLTYYIYTNKTDSIYKVTIDKTNYPDVFRPGTTKRYKVSAYDEYCKADNVSNIAEVKLNGYEVNLSDPGFDGKECLNLGDKLTITANFDDQNAANFISSYKWYKDDVLVGTSASSYDYTVENSSTSEFKLVVSDGICSDQSDSINVAVSVNYKVDLKADQLTVCEGTDNATVKAVITPATSMFQIKRFEWHAVVDGNDQIILNGTQKDSVLVLNSTNFPSMVKAGVSADIYVIADDSICDLSQSEGGLHFDFNTDYSMKIDWDTASSVCVSSESSIDPSTVLLTVDVLISPAEALKQIKEFQWHIKGDMETTWTNFSTINNHLELTYADLKKYAGQDISLYVSSYDGICSSSVDPDLSDTVKVKIRVGGFAIDLADMPTAYCLTDLNNAKIVLKAVFDPSSAQSNVSEYYWYDNDGLIATTKEDSLVLTSATYASILTAGYAANFSVAAYDEACAKDIVRSNNSTHVEFNVPFTLSVNSSSDAVCLPLSTGDDVILTATTEPANAASLIKKYVWHRILPSEKTAETTTNSFSMADWLEVTDNLTYTVEAFDDVCYNSASAQGSSANGSIAVNQRFVPTLGVDKNLICSVENELNLTTTIEPATAYATSYTYHMKFRDYPDSTFSGSDLNGRIAKVLSSSLPSDIHAGETITFTVVVDDNGVCGSSESNVQKVTVQTPFTLSVTSSSDAVCLPLPEGADVKLTATTNPPSAAGLIQKYVWHRILPSEKTVETTTNELPLADWLEVTDNLTYTVEAFDEACYTTASAAGSSTNGTIAVNQRFTPSLFVDKKFACSEGDSLNLKSIIIPDISYITSIKYHMKYKNGLDTIFNGTNSMKISSAMFPNDMTPGDVLGFTVVVDDGGVCGSTESDVQNVIVQTPYKLHVKSDTSKVCVNAEVNLQVVSVIPPEAAQFIQKYKWYEYNGLYAKSIPNADTTFYSTDSIPVGNYSYFVRSFDNICYISQENNSDTVSVNVIDSLRADFFPSSYTYCETVDDPISLTVTTTTGSPVRFELFDANTGEKLFGADVDRPTCEWEGYKPSREHNAYMVKIYDAVCNTTEATSLKLNTSIDVHVPVDFDLAVVKEDVCKGDSIYINLNVTSGTPNNYYISGFVTSDDTLIVPTNQTFVIKDIAQTGGTFDYSIYADDAICPASEVHIGTVNVHDTPVVELVADKSEVVIGGEIEFTANILAGDPTIFGWYCDGEEISVTTENRLNYLPKSTSNYQVYASDPVCPVAMGQMALDVKLPTAFTPYFIDGLNDTFMKGFEVLIFDRYGQKVYVGNDGWDGRRISDGSFADPGVYYFQVIMKDGKVEKGSVEVVKID